MSRKFLAFDIESWKSNVELRCGFAKLVSK